jgi:hypothetical protein
MRFMATYFITSTTVRWRAWFYQKHSIKYCFHLMTCCCFHVFPAQPFTYTLCTVSQFDITIFKGDRIARLFIDYFFIPCYNIQLLTAACILCQFLMHKTLLYWTKILCTYMVWIQNVDKFCTQGLQIIDIWVKQLHRHNALHLTHVTSLGRLPMPHDDAYFMF